MKYDFNKVQDRIGSDSIKWEKQLKFGTKTGLLPFWIAILTLQHCRKR